MNTETMTRQKFYEFAMDNIADYLPEDVRSENYNIRFTDIKKYQGLVVSVPSRSKGKCVATPVVNLDMFYDRYLEGECLDDLLKVMADVAMMVPPEEYNAESMSFIKDYEECKKRLFVSVCGAEDCKYDSYRTVAEDIALVARVLINDDGNGVSSAPVDSNLIDCWDVDVDTVIDDALANASVMYPVHYRSLRQMAIEMGMPANDDDGPEVYIVSNTNGFTGAPLFYEGVMEEIADKIGGDYFVIPSSIHEFLCMSASSITASALKKMVRDVNYTVLEPEDILTDSVYFYDAETKEFRKEA